MWCWIDSIGLLFKFLLLKWFLIKYAIKIIELLIFAAYTASSL